MDRRAFLLSAAGASLAAALPFRAAAQGPVPAASRRQALYVDGLGALDGIEQVEGGRYLANQRLTAAIRERRIDLMNVTVAPVGTGDNRYRDSVEAIAGYDSLIEMNPALLMKVESAADIRAARAAGKLGLIYNFQDTVALEGDASRVDTFRQLGLRVLQLTYNKRGLAGDGCLERANAGLSDYGREVIARINQNRILLDLSHAGQRTQAEGIAASTAPPAITHSGCRALMEHPRNTHDAEMRAVAEKGGVFGLYLMPFIQLGRQPDAADLLRHLDHAVNVCGEDHVSIGTDNPLLGYEINEETRRQHREGTAERVRRGIAAPGEDPEIMLYVNGYNGADRFDRIAADLRRRGWSSARVDKVLGGNLVRLLAEVWGP